MTMYYQNEEICLNSCIHLNKLFSDLNWEQQIKVGKKRCATFAYLPQIWSFKLCENCVFTFFFPTLVPYLFTSNNAWYTKTNNAWYAKTNNAWYTKTTANWIQINNTFKASGRRKVQSICLLKYFELQEKNSVLLVKNSCFLSSMFLEYCFSKKIKKKKKKEKVPRNRE